MSDERRIERFNVQPGARTVPAEDGHLCLYTDHLDALGEAEKTNRDIARREMDERETLEAKVAEQRTYIDLLVKAGKGSEDAFEAAEQKLESLWSGLKAEVEHYRDRAAEERDRSVRFKTVLEADGALREGERIDAIADRLEALDAPEDTEAAPVRKWTDEEVIDFALNTEHPEDTRKQPDLHSRSAIALVVGHLEGYADNLALPYPYNRNQLVEALREDAEKLKQSGGGES